MSKLSKVKMFLILGISLSIIVAFSNFVYAVDDDPFLNYAGNNSNSESQTSDNTNSEDDFEQLPLEVNNTNANTNNNSNVDNTNKANELLTSNTNIQNTNLNSNKNNNTNNNVNRNVSNTETLAKTGLTDSNGFVIFIVVLCSISAIYSFKKISEYKKI